MGREEFYFHVEEDFPSAKLLSFYHDDVFTGRPAWWFKFSVPPAEVPGVEQHYKDNWKKDRRDGYVKADTNIYVAEDRDPKWWHPDKLLNADAFEFGPQPGMWLCISRSTGEAYLCISGT